MNSKQTPTNMLVLTNNIDKITKDFGKFPSSVMKNIYGYFHSVDNTHIVSVYLGSNNNIYYASQCVTKSCPEYGHNGEKCVHVSSMCERRPGRIIADLLRRGFRYQMVYAVDGNCTYN